jgi:ATP-dependent RNA helicase DDX56/DBP9
MVKFNVLSGRTLVFVDTLYEAYKVKIFLEKFATRAAVVNPESTKLTRKSAVRYFHAGQYDILILIRTKYSFKLKTSDIVNIVNFTTPQNIQDYSLAARKLGFDNSSVLTFTYTENAKVQDNKEHKYMESLTKKMLKKHGRSLFVTLPINWTEVNKLKSRVDDIHCTLTNKKIKNYMANEIKRQILTNKKLKEYFNEHEEEKEILRSSVASDYKYRFMNQNLDFVPDYCYPKSILISAIEKKIEGADNDQLNIAEKVQGLTGDLLIVQKLNNLPQKKETKVTYLFEDPTKVDPEQLEFTAGRKLWKLKHKKRVRKGIRKAKDGYIGS